MADWFLHLPLIVQAIIRAILWVLLVFLPIPIFIWWERRLLGWFQDRIGPNRVGPFGLLQPIADGAKSFFKEDFAPSAVDRFIYYLAPALALFPPFAIGATVPWSPWRSLTPVADVNIGVLYILAVSSLGVYGVVLAGYSSNNKYSLMGGLRASAQLISYELSMGMSLAAIVLATGSLKLTDMLKAQEAPLYGVFTWLQNWNIFTPFGFVAGIIFLICIVAETNRAPFDLPEAENELVAGYNTEYSTKKWVLFMMGEYLSMFIFGHVFMTVFAGGYNLLPIRWDYLAQTYPSAMVWNVLAQAQYWLSPVIFMMKGFAVITFYIWLRATLPRLRYDQLMSLGWKSLLPIGVANFVVVALWIVSTRIGSEQNFSPLLGTLLGWASALVAIGLLVALYKSLVKLKPGEIDKLGDRRVRMMDVPAERAVVAPEVPVEVVS